MRLIGTLRRGETGKVTATGDLDSRLAEMALNDNPDLYEKQKTQPISIGFGLWVYRGRIVKTKASHELTGQSSEDTKLEVKHAVLKDERRLERIKREVQALENLERIPSAMRERIPHEIRLFVWQRDQGRCARCGSRERLEFDHIIPFAEGGATTERNIELLCESCNRSKGRNI